MADIRDRSCRLAAALAVGLVVVWGPTVRAVSPTQAAEDLAKEEDIRIQAEHQLGLQHLELGEQRYYQDRDYAAALSEFTQALKLIRDVEEHAELRDNARRLAVRSALALARVEMEEDRYDEARSHVDQALQLDPGNPIVARLDGMLEERKARLDAEAIRPTGPARTTEILQQEELVKDLFAQGRSLYLAGQYEAADKKFDQALAIDRFHLPSLRYKRLVQSQLYDMASYHRTYTVQERIRAVRDKWNEPIRRDSEIPTIGGERREIVKGTTEEIMQKLEGIVIPVLRYQNEEVSAVVDYIVEQSRLIDADGKGVNIVMSAGRQLPQGATGTGTDVPFYDQGTFPATGFPAGTGAGPGLGTGMEGGMMPGTGFESGYPGAAGMPGAGMPGMEGYGPGMTGPYGTGMGMEGGAYPGGMGYPTGAGGYPTGMGAYPGMTGGYPGAVGAGGYDQQYGALRPIPTVTVNLVNVRVIDAIKLICELANLKYRVEPAAVLISRTDEWGVGVLVTRLYPVEVGIFKTIFAPTGMADGTGLGLSGPTGSESGGGRMGSGTGGDFIGLSPSAQAYTQNITLFFAQAGVPFPPGASITYNERISTLIARNTPDNLEILERILSVMNVRPSQVEIETKFVEVAQTDIEELAFEWKLDDDYEILTGDTQTSTLFPISAQERIQVNAVPNKGSLDSNSGGFTSGLRFFQDLPAITEEGSSAKDNILSVSSILTNPELTFVLRALDQRGTAELLNAPKVLTVVGQGAQIEVVKEFRYPTEWEDTSSGGGGGGYGGGGSGGYGGSSAVFYPPIPSQIETRELGVLLSVTPLVGPDGWTINLTLIPEVSSFDRFIDYGGQAIIATSGGSSVFGTGGTPGFTSVDVPYLQPIFNSRNVTTTIQVWDGQTVVLGGLISEEAFTIDDKVPGLGDLPVLGRFFRSQVEQSVKRNLLIFVTARLVDPAGNSIHTQEDIDIRAVSGDVSSQTAASLGFP